MIDLNLHITRTISTGVMFFIPQNEDQYEEIENTIIAEFKDQDFSQVVNLNVDDEVCCQYWLSADVDDEAEFRIACAWVVGKMQDLGAPLDSVS
ncbi:hypothetical protein [Pectobacterium phage PcCB7V]|nr:hypothetical protein [Pectobacterium phage PcCB7V]